MNIFPFTLFGFVIDGWTLFGFFAQFLFFLRMMVQWIASERAKRSYIPVMYWYLSVLGSSLVLVYAIRRRDIVFTAGQFLAFVVYARNILLYGKREALAPDVLVTTRPMGNAITQLEYGQAGDFSQDYRLHSLLRNIPRLGGRLLDLGSGNGEIANILRGSFDHFTLADISEFLCRHLREKFGGRCDVSVLQCDAQAFSPDVPYDIVTMTDIIEHVPDDRAALGSAYRVLKPGGILFVSVPALPFLYGKRDQEAGHYRRYLKKDLQEKLRSQGFLIRDIRYWNMTGVLPYAVSEKVFQQPLNGPARKVNGFWSLILNRFLYGVLCLETYIPFLPLGVTLVAVAEKPNDA